MTVADKDFSGTKRSQVEHVKGYKAILRHNTADDYIYNEVVNRGDYARLGIREDDVVLDVGMNIGLFSLWAIRAGAASVHGYEPERSNFELARENFALNEIASQVCPHNHAVVGNDDATRELSINTKKNKGIHSLIAKRGRDAVTVTCVNINQVLSDVKPTIWKMDVEGAEYEILKGVESFGSVRELIFEFHHAHLNDMATHEKYIEIVRLLKAAFTTVHANRPGKAISIVYAHNSV